MNEPTFIIITKTMWGDAPRIRHQLARMIGSRGGKVFFVEKNGLLSGWSARRVEQNITAIRHGELAHHQLRAFRLVERLNVAWERKQMLEISRQNRWGNPVIVNCNYDSGYIRQVFPGAAIVTLLHDDHIAGAKAWMKAAAVRMLAETLHVSDAILAVSYPLVGQVEALGRSAELFLPWARSKYRSPDLCSSRMGILLWGYFYDNLDYGVLHGLASRGVPLHVAGPVVDRGALKKLLAHDNVRYHGIKGLEDMTDVLNSCCCSILPYRADAYDGTVAAVTFSNRAFELMAHGMPLLYADLPGLLRAPGEIVHRCRVPDDYLRSFEWCRSRFWEIQKMLERFLEPHYEEDRFVQLQAAVVRCIAKRGGLDAG